MVLILRHRTLRAFHFPIKSSDRTHNYRDDGNISSVPAEGGKVSTVYSDTKMVVTPPGGGPAISPDGKTIVFSGFKKGSPERKKGVPLEKMGLEF